MYNAYGNLMMSIVGIGTDIVDIKRIRVMLRKYDSFRSKFFTINEQTYARASADEAATLAGRFSAKEAISKAFGTGIRFSLKDIEILNDALGCPKVFLYGELKKRYTGYQLLVSISHTKEYASSTAICTTSNGNENEHRIV